MRFASLLAVCGTLFLAGCGDDAAGTSSDPTNDPVLSAGGSKEADGETPQGDASDASGQNETAPSTLPNAAGVVELSPANTTIQFVGTHAKADPDPDARTGVFMRFGGKAQIDPATGVLQAVSVDIETESLMTPIERLNNHLRSVSFFDVNEYPTARFESTKITPTDADPGMYTITGNLTMLATTIEVSIPAKVRQTDEGLTLDANFVVDRMAFGMQHPVSEVKKDVDLTVAVGKKTEPPVAEGRSRRGQ